MRETDAGGSAGTMIGVAKQLSERRRAALIDARYRYALFGREDADGLRSGDAHSRARWAYECAKTREEYEQALGEEADAAVMAELVERAWGTDVLNENILTRAWHLGGGSTLSAVLEPRCPEKLVQAWLRQWLNGQRGHGGYNRDWMLLTIARRHPHSVATIVGEATAEQMRTVQSRRVIDAGEYESVLARPWDDTSGQAVLGALAGLGQSRWDAASALLRECHFSTWALAHTELLGQAPVPVLRRWGVRAGQLPWSGARAMEIGSGMWKSFPGSVDELRDVCQDLVEA